MLRLLLLVLCLVAVFNAEARCRQERGALVCTAQPGVTYSYGPGANVSSSNAGMLSIAESERRYAGKGIYYATGVDTDGNRWVDYHARRRGSRFLLWSDPPQQQPERPAAPDDAPFRFVPVSDCPVQPSLEIHYGLAYSLACDAEPSVPVQ